LNCQIVKGELKFFFINTTFSPIEIKEAKHGDIEARRELRKYEGCVMKDETVIIVFSFSSIILPPSFFLSVPQCLRV